MPTKCVVVEVHVNHIGPNTCPGKVAQQVAWVLTGAVVPGMKVVEATGQNCTCADHQRPDEDWWQLQLMRAARKS